MELTKEEVLQMELADAKKTIYNLQERNIALESLIIAATVDKKSMQQALTFKDYENEKLNATIKKRALQEQLAIEKQKDEKMSVEHKSFVDGLKEKYALKDRWGYDPLTGAIANEDEEDVKNE